MYVPRDLENSRTIDTLVDSATYISAIAEYELERIKQQAPNNIIKNEDPFKSSETSGKKPKAKVTLSLNFGIGDYELAEDFVVTKKLTGPIIGLHFMRHNSVVIETTHGLIHFPHLTMQVKCNNSKKTANAQGNLKDDNLKESSPDNNKNTQGICWPNIEMENEGYCDPIGKMFHPKRMFANFSLNINNYWQTSSS